MAKLKVVPKTVKAKKKSKTKVSVIALWASIVWVTLTNLGRREK